MKEEQNGIVCSEKVEKKKYEMINKIGKYKFIESIFDVGIYHTIIIITTIINDGWMKYCNCLYKFCHENEIFCDWLFVFFLGKVSSFLSDLGNSNIKVCSFQIHPDVNN